MRSSLSRAHSRAPSRARFGARAESRSGAVGRAARRVAESLEGRQLLTAISSDQSVTGTLATATSTADYEITLAVGDSLLAMVGQTVDGQTFDPQVTVLRPDGSTFASDSSELGGEVVANNVTVAGVWKVRISDAGANDAGSYRLTVVAVDGAQSPNDGNGGAIASGQGANGALPLGDIDVFTATMNAGDVGIATAVDLDNAAGFQPQLRVYGPTGTFITSDYSELGTERTFTASTAGTYYFVIDDQRNGNASDNDLRAGNYRFRFVKVPGATQNQDDADGGTMSSGQRHDGVIDLGDIDLYTVSASAGDVLISTAVERGGDNDFEPRLRVYGPTGTSLGEDSSSLGGERVVTAATTGTYYFVVTDVLNGNAADNDLEAGNYTFRVVKAPGTPQAQDDADGGALTSGQRHDGTIELGDLDLYTVSATAGDAIVSTVAERNGDNDFEPRLRVYAPNGASLSEDSSSLGGERSFTATASGTYYFVISDVLNGNAGDNDLDAGDYTFRVAKLPAVPQSQDDADGGALTSGQKKNANLELGDIDVYTIGASAGETIITSVVERYGDLDVEHRLRIYKPTGGAAVFDDTSSLGTTAVYTATVTGTYYLVVTDALNGNASDNDMDAGEYTIRAVKPPSATTNDDADGGAISSGERRTGTLDRGDIDVFTFSVDTGDTIVTNVAPITSDGDLEPKLRIYNAAGTLVGQSDGDPGDYAALISSAATGGTYFAVITDVLNGNAGDNDIDSADYAFSLASHQATQVTDSDSGNLTSGQAKAGSISVGDIDVWRFAVTAGQSFTLRAGETGTQNLTPQLIVMNSAGTVVFNSSDAASLVYTLANPPTTGTYAAFVLDAGGDTTGSYSIALNAALGADNFAPSVLRSNYRYNDPLPSLRVEFSEPVNASFSIEDFTLQNLTTGVTLNNFDLTTAFETAKDNFTVTFDAFDGRVLPDGNYRLTIPKANITDPAGNPLASDLVYDFFVLTGDANRDRKVDFSDLVTLAQNYNKVGRTFAEGNFNYSEDGAVDFTDLVLLAQHYNQTLTPAIVAGSLSAGSFAAAGGVTTSKRRDPAIVGIV